MAILWAKDTNLPVSKIIKRLMQECGIRESELARKTGIPQTTINRLLLGGTVDPRANTLIAIAKYFNVTVGQLLGQEPIHPSRIAGTYSPTNRSAWSIIPVINWEQAISWVFQKENYTPSSHSDWVSTEQETSQNSFALKTLKFMEPRFREGSIIIVDPDFKFRDGQFIVVSISGSEATVRRVIKDGEEIYLKKLYGKEDPAKLQPKDTVIGTIVETRIKEAKY